MNVSVKLMVDIFFFDRVTVIFWAILIIITLAVSVINIHVYFYSQNVSAQVYSKLFKVYCYLLVI